MRWRRAQAADVPSMLALIGGYADQGLLLPRTEASLRARLADFVVALDESSGGDGVIGCGALSALGPRLAEVRSLAVRPAFSGRGIGHALVEHLLAEARERPFAEVLALTRRVAFFQALGFEVTRRERFLGKLAADCNACPRNARCDEVAMVRRPEPSRARAGRIPAWARATAKNEVERAFRDDGGSTKEYGVIRGSASPSPYVGRAGVGGR